MNLFELLRRIFRGRPVFGEEIPAGRGPLPATQDNRLTPPSRSADVSLIECEDIGPVLECLARQGVEEVTIPLGDDPDQDELLAAVALAGQRGMKTVVRGRATVLAQGGLIGQLAAQGLDRLDILILSSISEVHDALAGAGDRRNVSEVLRQARESRLRTVAHLALVPATWQALDRTLEFLADEGVEEVALFAIAAPDVQASAWVYSDSQLPPIAAWAEEAGRRGDRPRIRWCPPQRFDPARSLAEQVRRGPSNVCHRGG